MKISNAIAAVLKYPFFLWADSYETFVFTHGEYGELWGWLLYQVLPFLLMVGFVVAWVFFELSK